MTTRLTDIAEQLESVHRGNLPYAPTDRDELEVINAALAEIKRIEAAGKKLAKELKTRHKARGLK